MENFIKPWHGIHREQIIWHPTIEEEICTGCGICITGCGRMVYKLDYEKKKPVVIAPLNCMVACVTCANVCPSRAISFPPLSYVHKMIKENDLIKKSREELNNNREKYEKK
jgi:CDP-4-dehydro-6-deoxyglucose reductase